MNIRRTANCVIPHHHEFGPLVMIKPGVYGFPETKRTSGPSLWEWTLGRDLIHCIMDIRLWKFPGLAINSEPLGLKQLYESFALLMDRRTSSVMARNHSRLSVVGTLEDEVVFRKSRDIDDLPTNEDKTFFPAGWTRAVAELTRAEILRVCRTREDESCINSPGCFHGHSLAGPPVKVFFDRTADQWLWEKLPVK